jgi:hypothetical protein
MNIYMITRADHCNDYDVFHGAVVYAESAAAARNMHPKDGKPINDPKRSAMSRDTWVTDPKQVTVRYLGVKESRTRPGIIMTDFSAG